MTLLEALKKIRDEGPIDTNYGICRNVLLLAGWEPHNLLHDMLSKWPQCSGEYLYPVSGEEDYTRNWHNGTLWQGEQRDLRMSLINFCIKELENENLTSDSSGSR